MKKSRYGVIPCVFTLGLKTVGIRLGGKCSSESSRDFLSAPVLNLGTNPDNRTSTPSNLLWKITFIHHSIDGGFRQASDFLDLLQANVRRLIKHERQKSEGKGLGFLAFCLVRQKTREGMSGQFLGNALAGLGLFDLYRSGRCGALRFDE